jgi:hypothetical protein
MELNEFKECFEKLRENIDKFIKQVEINDEIIKTYMQISEQVINELEKQEKEIEKYKQNNLFEVWKAHLKENKKYGFKDLAEEIELKLDEYDKKLKEFLEEKEKIREKILIANKRK